MMSMNRRRLLAGLAALPACLPAAARAAIDMLRGASLPPPGTAQSRVVRLRYRLSD